MPEYIAILRGINVSGQKKIKMADLKELLEKSGFENVRTYIQSGNVVFEHKSSPNNKLADKITQLLQNAYGFDVPVIVLTADELVAAVKNNPFTNTKAYYPDKIYLTFLQEVPSDENLKKLNEVDSGSEEFKKIKKVIYLYMPDGYGRAKLNNNFIENKLKVRATTRNWKTANKLIEMIN